MFKLSQYTIRRDFPSRFLYGKTSPLSTAAYYNDDDHNTSFSSSQFQPSSHLPPPLVNCELDTRSTTFQDAMKRTNLQVEDLNEMLQKASKGGGPEAVKRHHSRGKFLPRERIQRLVDPGTPLLELTALAGCNSKDHIPSGGIVTAIGMVAGRMVMIVANDATVKGGTYYTITVKKHLRAQEIALENKLPCIYLVDSGGAYLPKQADVFPDKVRSIMSHLL